LIRPAHIRLIAGYLALFVPPRGSPKSPLPGHIRFGPLAHALHGWALFLRSLATSSRLSATDPGCRSALPLREHNRWADGEALDLQLQEVLIDGDEHVCLDGKLERDEVVVLRVVDDVGIVCGSCYHGQSLRPAPARLSFTRHQTWVHAIHPSVFPRPRPPGWNELPLRLSPELRTPPDKNQTTHLRVGTGQRARAWNYTLNITSGPDVVMARALDLGALVVHPLVDQTDYPSRDFTIVDPDGSTGPSRLSPADETGRSNAQQFARSAHGMATWRQCLSLGHQPKPDLRACVELLQDAGRNTGIGGIEMALATGASCSPNADRPISSSRRRRHCQLHSASDLDARRSRHPRQGRPHPRTRATETRFGRHFSTTRASSPLRFRRQQRPLPSSLFAAAPSHRLQGDSRNSTLADKLSPTESRGCCETRTMRALARPPLSYAVRSAV
jgi:hypothetical protein